MKKLLIFSLIMTAALIAFAAGKAKIEFAKTSHDFGTIQAKGGTVNCSYEFTNTGDAPLLIVNVTNGGCGCTTPTYPKEPIQPGKSGVITIHFNPSGRKGEFNRTVTVTTNGTKKNVKLKFSGTIIP